MPHHPLIEDCEKLHIRQLQAAIPRQAVSAFVQVAGTFGVQDLQITAKRSNLGIGYRYYLLCPQCQKACLYLYRRDYGTYACRKCLGLLYASSLRIEL